MDTADPQAVFPKIVATVLDTTNARQLAEFYRELLGYSYVAGDEAPPAGEPDEADWLTLFAPGGGQRLAFQQVAKVEPPTWPEGPVPQQLHLDFSVDNAEELQRQRERALGLGATLLFDRFDDGDEPLYVFADPSGHPFCIFVG
jgi:catechol 2,3-dioxygenase-like lactoylglutathione lyase family enzyme